MDMDINMTDFTIFREDGSLDLQKLSWGSDSEKSAMSVFRLISAVEKIHADNLYLKVQNNILQGKINTYQNN